MKKLVIDELRNAHQMGAADAERAVDNVTAAILAVTKANGRAALPNFGVFAVKQRAERMSRNPQTGEPVKVAAKQAITFKPSKGVI